MAAVAVLGYLLVGVGFWIYSLPKDELLPFREDFQSGNLSQWNRLGWRQLCCEHSLRLVSDPMRPDRQAARFELNRGDPLVRSNQRAELRLPAANMGAEYRFAFSVYLPPDWTADDMPTNLVQWHSVSDKLLFEGGPSMPLRLVVIGDRWIIDNFWDSKWVTKFAYLPERPEGNRLIWSGGLDRGRWVDWEFRVRWSWQPDGLIEVRKDGVMVARAVGANTYRDLVAPYMKFGVYVPAWTVAEWKSPVSQRVAYFRNIAVDKR
ncbi:polysaccharide lyase [soil metagenome]